MSYRNQITVARCYLFRVIIIVETVRFTCSVVRRTRIKYLRNAIVGEFVDEVCFGLKMVVWLWSTNTSRVSKLLTKLKLNARLQTSGWWRTPLWKIMILKILERWMTPILGLIWSSIETTFMVVRICFLSNNSNWCL